MSDRWNERPVTPIDRTLRSRPVPRIRTYEPQPFGAGETEDIDSLRTQTIVGPVESTGDNREMQDLLDNYADPTWGFTVFVTAYDTFSKNHLVQAVQNWVKIQYKVLNSGFLNTELASALSQRFCLEVIQDKTSLNRASDDRIRAEFRAFLRGREIIPDGDDDGEQDAITGPARNIICFVLDAEAISTLAGLTDIESSDGTTDYSKIMLKVVDAYWSRADAEGRGGVSGEDPYRGIMMMTITGLARLYTALSDGSLAMDEIYGLDTTLHF